MKAAAEFHLPSKRFLICQAMSRSISNVLLVAIVFFIAAVMLLTHWGITSSTNVLNLGSVPSSNNQVIIQKQNVQSSHHKSLSALDEEQHHQQQKNLNRNQQNQQNGQIQAQDHRVEEPGTGIHSTIRHLHPAGLAAYTFVLTGGYRTYNRGFAVVGLASKPLHVFGKPTFKCEWQPTPNSDSISDSDSDSTPASVWGRSKKLLPDWGYGRVYTVVVVHCFFDQPVGEDRSGGRLRLHVGTGDSIDPSASSSIFTAFQEAPGQFNASAFSPPYKYDYLYCGSSLYGDVNPQRMREWLAYHAMLFGERSHFVFHDVGGASSEGMRQVLEPWVKLGMVTVHDFSEQARFDGYYYNQFLVVNDCLFRYKYAAKWTFFFDVDEYVYIPKPGTLESVLDELGQNYTQIMFEQYLMGHNMCVEARGKHKPDLSRQWGFEKLVFKNVQKSVRLDRKYVLKAALADSAGVHLSEHVRGKSLYSKNQIVYYHYHNTITQHQENCREFFRVSRNKTEKVWLNKVPYIYDNSMSSMVKAAKNFELERIGQAVLQN